MLRGSLISIASKLLSSEHSKLEDLSLEEQNLWKSFDNSDIYEFITGEPDCLPEFQFDWIEPCQLVVPLPPGFAVAPSQHQQPPPAPIKPPAQPQVQHVLPPAPPAQILYQPVPHVPEHEPVAGPSAQLVPDSQHQHDLRPCQDINYKELHTGVKCCSLRRKAKAVVTKLAPGSFSLKQPPSDQPPDLHS